MRLFLVCGFSCFVLAQLTKANAIAMDYEDDFSWHTSPDVDPQDHQDLLVVRFLIENGYIPEHFDGAPPPASKAAVANLEERKVKIYPLNLKRNVEKCVICLKIDPKDDDDYDYDEEDDDNDDGEGEGEDSNQQNEEGARLSAKNAFYEKTFKVMPCSHAFHR